MRSRLRSRVLPSTLSSEAVAAAAGADNRVDRWPLTPRLTRWRRGRGAAEREAAFEEVRAQLGVRAERDARGDVVMTSELGARSAAGEAADAAWMLWIHGGGFCWGEARDRTGARLADGLRWPVVSVDYPLAPEARFPLAIDHCLAAYEAGVRERGSRVLLGGVSAGANLALGVLQRIRASRAEGEGIPLPVGVVGLTPFGDLAGEGDSYCVNEGRDAYLRWRGQQQRYSRAYAGHADLRDPLVSPIHADWGGEVLPPAILTTGTRDLFLSDTARIHTAWCAAGGEADLVLAEGLWHSYLSDASLPESAALLTRLLDWCEGVLRA